MDSRTQKYIDRHCSPPSEALEKIARDTYLTTMAPQMLSGRMQGRLLSLLSHLVQPQEVLEIGTFTGYGTVCLAEGLKPEGTVHTIEANPELEHRIRTNIALAALEDKIKLYIGRAENIIPGMTEIFDLVFIDAGKKDYPLFYDLVVPKVRSGGLILIDNVLWDGKVIGSEQDLETRQIRKLNQKVVEDERVQNVMIPLRDGLMLCLKK